MFRSGWVRFGYLYADTGLVFRHYRVVESGYEDAFVLQAGGHLLGQLGVVQHNCADSGLGGLDVEAGSLHLAYEVVGVLVQTVLKLVGLLHHVEHADTSCGDHGRDGVGEEVRP